MLAEGADGGRQGAEAPASPRGEDDDGGAMVGEEKDGDGGRMKGLGEERMQGMGLGGAKREGIGCGS